MAKTKVEQDKTAKSPRKLSARVCSIEDKMRRVEETMRRFDRVYEDFAHRLNEHHRKLATLQELINLNVFIRRD